MLEPGHLYQLLTTSYPAIRTIKHDAFGAPLNDTAAHIDRLVPRHSRSHSLFIHTHLRAEPQQVPLHGDRRLRLQQQQHTKRLCKVRSPTGASCRTRTWRRSYAVEQAQHGEDILSSRVRTIATRLPLRLPRVPHSRMTPQDLLGPRHGLAGEELSVRAGWHGRVQSARQVPTFPISAVPLQIGRHASDLRPVTPAELGLLESDNQEGVVWPPYHGQPATDGIKFRYASHGTPPGFAATLCSPSTTTGRRRHGAAAGLIENALGTYVRLYDTFTVDGTPAYMNTLSRTVQWFSPTGDLTHTPPTPTTPQALVSGTFRDAGDVVSFDWRGLARRDANRG